MHSLRLRRWSSTNALINGRLRFAPLPYSNDCSPWRPGRPVMAQCKLCLVRHHAATMHNCLTVKQVYA
jgi:hypothetical protein